MSEPELVLRPALETDVNFIRRTWLSGLRELPNGLPDEHWWPAHRAYVDSCLFSENHRVVIAGSSDDPHEILGYAVGSKEVLEWVHVRKGLRNRGIAGVLLRGLGYDPAQNRPAARWATRSSRTHLAMNFRPWELRK